MTLRRDELRAAIERVAQFADERSRAIRVQLLPRRVEGHSSLSETGESEESVAGEYGGRRSEIGFNAQYLLDFLRAVAGGAGRVPLQGCAERRRDAAGRRQTADSYRYVIMPMRI